MNTESPLIEKPHERTIVVRALYLGDEPALSRRKEPFFLGSMPIIEGITKGIPAHALIHYYGQPFPNVEFLAGSLSHDRDEERSGVSKETVLVIYDVPMSEAERWKEIPDWKFERLSWSKYRNIQQSRFEHLTKKRDKILYKLTNNWYRFFGITLYEQLPTVIRIDIRAAKHQCDPEFKSTDRYHYYVNLKGRRINDLLTAVEYIEQGFFLLNVECELSVSFDGEEVYKTPPGLTIYDDPRFADAK